MRTAIISFLLAALLPGSAWARTIVFATDAAWPPMEFVGADRKLDGFSIDYLKAVGQEAGFAAEFKVVSWDGIFAGLIDGKYDAVCSSVSITPERSRTVDFSTPYFKVRQAVVTRVDSPAANLADLGGKKVGALVSTTGQFTIKNNPALSGVSYDEVKTALADLAGGSIEAVVCDDPVAAELVRADPDFKGKLKIAFLIDAVEDELYAIAVKKGDAQTLALINAGIAAVQAKGVEKALIAKWLGQ